MFDKLKLPWENLISILMDSCNIMRGSKSGLETLIRKHKAHHMLDIDDGDSCHHAHNAAKSFCEPFEKEVESLLTKLYNDFKWSPDKKQALKLICEALVIQGTTPENYVSHRWLSVYAVYDVCVDTDRLWDAYVEFYYSFLSDSDHSTYLSVLQDIYKIHNVDKPTQDAIKKVQKMMKEKIKKRMTKEGLQRVKYIVQKIFHTGPKTKVIIHVFVSVLPLLKKYVMLFQGEKPMVHLLNDKETELLQDFLACFINSEKLKDATARTLIELKVEEPTNHLPDATIFLAKYIHKKLPASLAKEIIVKLKAGYVKCAQCLQRKMPVNNSL
ncbi:uncharacterized protein LOC121410920 [Lytechinus variegatus]|uniref:uncharacterized protein LOC121410920 n=1 Tax=Lytechinus variegatus TaxID=7654 RepID=UPI001BB1D9C9|nr:uncharacterized protein LOC121410920 [Lytechinus variegatus]